MNKPKLIDQFSDFSEYRRTKWAEREQQHKIKPVCNPESDAAFERVLVKRWNRRGAKKEATL